MRNKRIEKANIFEPEERPQTESSASLTHCLLARGITAREGGGTVWMTREGHRAIGADLSPLYIFGGAGACALALAAGLSLRAGPASALPSFARQTGQPCATCHNGVFPQLTPYGRQFKLNGYTSGGTRCHDSVASDPTPQIPISVMLLPTYTHIGKDLVDLPVNRDGDLNGLKTNNNVMVQSESVFYGGQIYCQLGAFIQATYSRTDEAFGWDNADIRYANRANVHGMDLIYGLTVNNNPTVEDPWNTTPAWRIPGDPFPAFDPGFPAPLIDGLGTTVAGAGAYVFANNMFYAAVSAYRTLDKDALGTWGMHQSIRVSNHRVRWRSALLALGGREDLGRLFAHARYVRHERQCHT